MDRSKNAEQPTLDEMGWQQTAQEINAALQELSQLVSDAQERFPIEVYHFEAAKLFVVGRQLGETILAASVLGQPRPGAVAGV